MDDAVNTLEADSAWVRAFKRGERAALERVFLRYADDVAAQVRKTRLPEHDVESVVQDVFLKAFSEAARDSYDGLRPFGAWLRTMTRNLLIDRLRKDARLQFYAPEDLPTVLSNEDAPDAHHDTHELRAVLGEFTQSLAGEEARLFELRFVKHTSLSKAAELLGWSEIRVRKFDTQVRVRLLQALKRAGFLVDAKVRIGQSLLARKQKAEG
jgi:RNA polymerase sigma-70 factor (ECF subfamily)